VVKPVPRNPPGKQARENYKLDTNTEYVCISEVIIYG